MSDIVEKLRALSEEYRDHDPDVVAFSAEAAAELTRLRAERDAAKAEAERLREALKWYGEQARLARLIHAEGDAGRHALAADGGGKARAALQEKPHG